MAKKPKDDRKHMRLLPEGGTVIPLGHVAVDVVRKTAPRLFSATIPAERWNEPDMKALQAECDARGIDPVILLMRQCFGRYQLEMKLTKKRENPLSRD